MSDYLKNYLRHKIWYWNNKPFLRLNCSLRQGTFYNAPCIAVEPSVCLNSVTTIFLLAKSSHFLLRITPAVRTRGSHFQFAFYRFAISQFTVRKLPNPDCGCPVHRHSLSLTSVSSHSGPLQFCDYGIVKSEIWPLGGQKRMQTVASFVKGDYRTTSSVTCRSSAGRICRAVVGIWDWLYYTKWL